MNIAIIGDSFPQSLLLNNGGYPHLLFLESESLLKKNINLKVYADSGIRLSNIKELFDDEFYNTKWDYIILHCGNFEAFPSISENAKKIIPKRWVKEDLRHRLKYRNKITEISFTLKQELRRVFVTKLGIQYKTEKKQYEFEYNNIIELIRKEISYNNFFAISLGDIDSKINPGYKDILDGYNEVIKKVCKEQNINIIDVSKLKKLSTHYIYTKDGWHWNEHGHSIVFSLIYKKIFGVDISQKVPFYTSFTGLENEDNKERKLIKPILNKGMRLIEIPLLYLYLFYFKKIRITKSLATSFSGRKRELD